MSRENRELYHHDHHFLRDRSDLPFHDDLSPFFSQGPGASASQELRGFHLQAASPYMSIAEYLHGSSDYGLLSKAFDASCSSPEMFGPRDGGLVNRELVVDASIGTNLNVSTGGGGDGGTTPLTPNSSVSSSSSEAAGEEDSGRCKKYQQKVEEEEKQQLKGSEEGGDKSKKV